MSRRLLSHQLRAWLKHQRATLVHTKRPTECSSASLPRDLLVDEERNEDYDINHFYNVYPGLLLQDRYELVSKLGFGRHSTVWLARDLERWRWQPARYVAIKINISGAPALVDPRRELAISQHINKHSDRPEHRFLRTHVDYFPLPKLNGPEHVCLVYEPLRESMLLFQQRLNQQQIPVALLKVYVKFFLQGLNHLHSVCHIIHTDLKQDNIMMGFEHPTVLENYVKQQTTASAPFKLVDGQPIYLSQFDFGSLKSFLTVPKIVDFGLAERGDVQYLLRHPIQPPLYRAPEVLIGSGWSYSADIWNLGVLTWNLLENKDLFEKIQNSDGSYSSRAHIADMIALLGPAPIEIATREKRMSELKWPHTVPNAEGKLCQCPREFYNGPFFGPNGEYLYPDIIPTDRSLSASLSTVEGDEKEAFLDFIRGMLQWLPEKRKTARELLNHPWLELPPRNPTVKT